MLIIPHYSEIQKPQALLDPDMIKENYKLAEKERFKEFDITSQKCLFEIKLANFIFMKFV